MTYIRTIWNDRIVENPLTYYMRDNGGSNINLLPPFTEWEFNHPSFNPVIDPQDDYKLTASPNESFRWVQVRVPVLPNTVYTLSTQARYGYIAVFNESITESLPGAAYNASGNITFNSGEHEAVFVLFGNSGDGPGAYHITHPQLELGSAATTFGPRKHYQLSPAPGATTQVGTPLNAANLNKLEIGVQQAHHMILGLDTDASTPSYHANGQLYQIVETKDGGVIRTTTYTYNPADGSLSTETVSGNGVTVTTTYSYNPDGTLGGETKAFT
ncbi:hypothetical protein [Paenibacillus methanolicus]|uniref:Uncharacterized protein n=1 Tax=Paenibacillus methanolicus TaxID=582686 RepID=A0A5S5BL51_9BACL|nr:hypothetical protein [Paenibacillus methanolicus]TYP67704.1 hypothetical protein BCM02_12329 [Paenibacillus methanolicus]